MQNLLLLQLCGRHNNPNFETKELDHSGIQLLVCGHNFRTREVEMEVVSPC